MGYQKIQQKQNELDGKRKGCQQFFTVASGFNSRLAEIQRAATDLQKFKKDTAKAIQSLSPGGVKEFEDLQKAMMAACMSDDPAPISTSAAEKFLKDSQNAMDREMDDWINKLASNMPAKIEVGMTFKNYISKRLIVITGGPTQSQNRNLSGDAALWYSAKMADDNKALSLSKADLSPKKGWKFVKV